MEIVCKESSKIRRDVINPMSKHLKVFEQLKKNTQGREIH